MPHLSHLCGLSPPRKNTAPLPARAGPRSGTPSTPVFKSAAELNIGFYVFAVRFQRRAAVVLGKILVYVHLGGGVVEDCWCGERVGVLGGNAVVGRGGGGVFAADIGMGESGKVVVHDGRGAEMLVWMGARSGNVAGAFGMERVKLGAATVWLGAGRRLAGLGLEERNVSSSGHFG